MKDIVILYRLILSITQYVQALYLDFGSWKTLMLESMLKRAYNAQSSKAFHFPLWCEIFSMGIRPSQNRFPIIIYKESYAYLTVDNLLQLYTIDVLELQLHQTSCNLIL